MESIMGVEIRQKMHCGANLFTLRCAYSHTAVQIFFDCGATFSDFLFKNTEKGADDQPNCEKTTYLLCFVQLFA